MDRDGKPRDVSKIIVTDVVLATSADLPFSIIPNDKPEIPLSKLNLKGIHNMFAAGDLNEKIGNWKLVIKNKDKVIDQALMIVRFILK